MSEELNRLEELQPYVIGIRFFGGMPVVEANFKDKWTIPESTVIGRERIDENGTSFMFFSRQDGIGMTELLDYIEGIIELNIEREKESELFKIKIKELQKLFTTNTLTKLQNMRFVLGIEPTIAPEFNPDDINLEDEIELEEPTPQVVEQPERELAMAEEQTPRVFNTSKVELPPKPSNGKAGSVELDGNLIPEEAKLGPCTHGPEEACIKCMDDMSM